MLKKIGIRGKLLIALGFIAVGYIISSAYFGGGSSNSTPLWKEISFKDNPPPSSLSNFVELVRRVKPAVVNISTSQVIKEKPLFPHSPFGPKDPFEEFMEKFFGEIPRREFRQRSLGSGVIINREGYILTNNHVVENATEITVILSDEEEYEAKKIGSDAKTDLALIKINPHGELTVAPLGDSDKLEIGEWVIAIGNPYGLGHTVTAGIVSAKGRALGFGPYDSFIQTDASINPGNSGGPLINMNGEVVGINTAIIAAAQGIGFAIPINLAKDILPQLKEKGKVTRGWLGVMIQKVTPELAKSFGLEKPRGALVSDIIEGSPAEKAGIMKGDIILEFNRIPIKEWNELPAIVARTPPGKVVEIKILRQNKEMSLHVTIGELREEPVALQKGKKEDLGLSLQELTPELSRQFGMQGELGLLVVGVEPGSPADDAGFRKGDIIREINHKPVKRIKEYKDIVAKAKPSETILFYVRRGSGYIYIAVRMR